VITFQGLGLQQAFTSNPPIVTGRKACTQAERAPARDTQSIISLTQQTSPAGKVTFGIGNLSLPFRIKH